MLGKTSDDVFKILRLYKDKNFKRFTIKIRPHGIRVEARKESPYDFLFKKPKAQVSEEELAKLIGDFKAWPRMRSEMWMGLK
ncbi:hypothetical protein GN244_ATG20376 [Phytophthora infestans]|uniref:Uncharacterized protein n=1 Tax=Phytophthora infestans TaxID=4787 RepID=A0A833W468_PHYIN|nr:hypothetical protein GN244_ATG20376 [Phytophthora infestans]